MHTFKGIPMKVIRIDVTGRDPYYFMDPLDPDESRKILNRFCQNFKNSLTADERSELKAVKVTVTLIEMEPKEYVPLENNAENCELFQEKE